MINALDPASLQPARLNVKLSPKELADLAGVHVTTITRIEAGKVDPRLNGTWAPLVEALQKLEQAAEPKKARAA